MTPPEPLVEIRVPVYRRARFLAAALDSVLTQTFTDWKLVVQENGEGDDEVRAAVAPYLSDPRITHEIVGRELSQPENWTAAITRATSRYLALLHDDDTWDPGFLERRVAFLEANSDCAFAFAGNRWIDEEGAELRRRPFVELPEGRVEPEAIVRALYVSNFIQPPTILVRLSAYRAVGGRFDDEWPFHMDYLMWLALAARFPVGFFRLYDNSWRAHGGALTAALPPMGEKYVEFFAHLEEVIAAAMPDLELDPALRRRKWAYAHIKACLDDAEEGNRREAWRHLRAAIRWNRGSLLDPRTPVAALAIVSGGRSGPALARLRGFVARHEINVHMRDRPI